MIEIKNKANCTGCTACASICPKNAIKMVANEEGFRYPVIDKEKCINCNLCSKVCPMLKQYNIDEKELKFYAAYNKNTKIKNESTSGGFVTALAEKIIDSNGVVYGAAFDKDFNVIHCGVKNKEDLSKFRSSKYVQSDLRNTYREVKENLENNITVLFSGTPCQIYGLKSFLQREYPNLICVEVICRGTPSPKYYQYYKENKIKKYKSEIQSLSFRKKTYGYNSSTMSIKFKNGKEYNRGHESDELIKAFLKGYCSKESCYSCHFKSFSTIGDFKVGDLWNLGKFLGNDFQDGTTLVICCSEKSREIINEFKDNVELKEISKDNAEFYNGNGNGSMILYRAQRPPERDTFLVDLEKLGFEKTKKKYLKLKPKDYIKMKLKPILYKMNLLDKIKLRSK